MACEFCKTAEVSNQGCPNCGKFSIDSLEVDLVYGDTRKRRVVIRYSQTDRFFIIRTLHGVEKSTNGLGILLGAVIASVVVTANAGKSTVGYYNLKELREVIYPYHNSRYKKDVALKFVFLDGTEFIIETVVADSAKDMANKLRIAGVPVTAGRPGGYGDLFCQKPVGNENTVGTRICASASRFVKMMPGNFVVEDIRDPNGSRSAPSESRNASRTWNNDDKYSDKKSDKNFDR